MTDYLYTSRDEAIQRLIIDPIEASGEVKDARAEYDIDAIADELIIQSGSIMGHPLYEAVTYSDRAIDYWATIERHAL